MYGTTAGGAPPYVTGAVVQGSHAGGQAAIGAGAGRHQLQQPQPALLTVNKTKSESSDILFIDSVSLRETFH